MAKGGGDDEKDDTDPELRERLEEGVERSDEGGAPSTAWAPSPAWAPSTAGAKRAREDAER